MLCCIREVGVNGFIIILPPQELSQIAKAFLPLFRG